MAGLHRVLVANRGEIARRLIRGAHDAGVEAVAVYAQDDATSPHVGEADAAVLLTGTALSETYLERGGAGGGGRGVGLRRHASGLRVPVGEPGPARGLRGRGHRLGRPTDRGHARHGPQGAGQGGRGGGRGAGAAERARRGRGVARRPGRSLRPPWASRSS